MGEVQRIFYFHVSAAWVGFFAFFVVFLGGIFYLRSREIRWQITARASAEIGVIFSTFVLGSGMFWGRAAWNVWWTWDPRLTTTLIMWFIYIGYLFLDFAGGRQAKSRQTLTAIYGILAFINIPLVFMSIRWWRTLHPAVIGGNGGGLTPRMIHTLIFTLIVFSLLYFVLMSIRRRQLFLQERIELLRQKME